MGNKIKRFRLIRSPFMLGSVSGMVAMVLSFIWPAAEILKEMTNIDIVSIVHIILIIGFPICFTALIYAIKKYIKNGYLRKECTDEMEYLKSRIDLKSFKNFIKAQEDAAKSNSGE